MPTCHPPALLVVARRERHAAAAARRFGAALALVGALLLSQGLGVLHRVLHDPLQTPAAHAVWADRVADTHPASPLSGLFDGHQDGSAECRLLDQWVHADALLVAVLPLLLARLEALPDSVAPPTPARRHTAQYRARAPPPR